MSIPDSNASASVMESPSLSTASETLARPVNTTILPPSQPPPAPPPPPPPTYRPIAPFRHPNPLQQAHNNLYAQSIPNIRPNQDPSAVLYPFAPPGRGFPARPVRGFLADQSGYPPRPGVAYNLRQFGPTQMETMMQLMRGRNPQLPRLGAASPVGSGPRRGSPQFLQPRVAPPRTSVQDTSRNRKARGKDEALILVRGRKVRITEGASLYSLGRSWLKNGAHVGIQPQRSGIMKPLPRPLPVDMTETSVPAEESADEDEEDEEAVKELSEKDLLKRHIERAKKIRARLREERLRKIKRYKERIALLLPRSEEEK
ncbi:hypothetical protein CARUB_v10009801mg [Capsella rubella]|uniref:Proline-rich family protein n=1 Tax=Capsella rubella TaxID=81985 RepID=R0GMD1_9BRAS|nr:uncharacterized protein LOC17897684 [Capsella rubella]EOA36931.1 hypothetical protein CARUB_v10009801mg [Capsella rubella]